MSDVSTRVMPYDDAVKSGAIALFGEKYEEDVRVLSMGREGDGAYSVELCGGTHARRVGDIALFVITSESAVAAGIRRIEALTGEAARLHLEGEARLARAAADAAKAPLIELPARIEALVAETRKLERDLSEAKKKLALGGSGGQQADETATVNGVKFIGKVLDGVEAKDLRGLVDQAKKTLGSGVAAFISVADGKASLAVGVTEDLVKRVSAVDLARDGAKAMGGAGGRGRPDMAQAGGPDGSKAIEAIEAMKTSIAG